MQPSSSNYSLLGKCVGEVQPKACCLSADSVNMGSGTATGASHVSVVQVSLGCTVKLVQCEVRSSQYHLTTPLAWLLCFSCCRIGWQDINVVVRPVFGWLCVLTPTLFAHYCLVVCSLALFWLHLSGCFEAVGWLG